MIMQNIKLDTRLAAVASLVRNGSRLADVGTDHGYIPVYLVKKGTCPLAVAGDINEGPLLNAYNNIKDHGLSDKIQTVLSNGLDGFEPNCADDIIIAGMGGILISEILSRCSWIKNKNIRLIVQPMTHAEKVREFFINNGFVIEREIATKDARHKYCIISAHYDPNTEKHSKGYIYYGELLKNNNSLSFEYIKSQKDRLLKRYNALKLADDNSDEISYLKEIIDELTFVLGGNENDNS